MGDRWTARDDEWLEGLRDRVRGHLRFQMVDQDLNAARTSERTGLKTGSVSNLVYGEKTKGERVSIGLDVFARIARGLGISAQTMIYETAPAVRDDEIPLGPQRRGRRRRDHASVEPEPLLAAEPEPPAYGKPAMTPAQIAQKKMDEIGAKALASIPKEAEALRHQMKNARKKQIR